jgi:hypothetical protein
MKLIISCLVCAVSSTVVAHNIVRVRPAVPAVLMPAMSPMIPRIDLGARSAVVNTGTPTLVTPPLRPDLSLPPGYSIPLTAPAVEPRRGPAPGTPGWISAPRCGNSNPC